MEVYCYACVFTTVHCFIQEIHFLSLNAVFTIRQMKRWSVNTNRNAPRLVVRDTYLTFCLCSSIWEEYRQIGHGRTLGRSWTVCPHGATSMKFRMSQKSCPEPPVRPIRDILNAFICHPYVYAANMAWRVSLFNRPSERERIKRLKAWDANEGLLQKMATPCAAKPSVYKITITPA